MDVVVASLEKQRETWDLVIYVQIGSGFMLLCNLLLKCPIINHTFGQVIISVASNLTHLENIHSTEWLRPWSQIQNFEKSQNC